VFEDGRMLVTERPGRLRIVTPGGELSEPVAGLPKVDARDQGGLFDVAIDPDFSSNQTIYWSYAEPREGGNGAAMARGRLITGDGDPRVEDVQVLFRQMPTLDSTLHFGSRIAIAPDGTLFLTLGERGILEGRVQAQDLEDLLRISTVYGTGSAGTGTFIHRIIAGGGIPYLDSVLSLIHEEPRDARAGARVHSGSRAPLRMTREKDRPPPAPGGPPNHCSDRVTNMRGLNA
jgi:hypothetical protein